jgi:ketosteroid isomerase-like protein
MKKLFLIIPLVFLLCFTFSCQKAEEVAEQEKPKEAMDLVQVRQLIEETNIKFGEFVQAGDASALANLYTEDTMLLPPPKAPIIKGREGVEAYWATGFQMGLKDVVLTTVEVMAIGDMVCEIGNAEATFHPEGMDEFKDMGKYLVIWKNIEGIWKLHVDIYNSSLPAQ